MGTGASTPHGQVIRVLPGWSQTPVSGGALHSSFLLFLFQLSLTFAEAQRKTAKMSHSLFSFLHLLADSRHFSSGSLQSAPCECRVWVSPCRGAPICAQFWVSHCHPPPASPHLPSQGRGTTGSCLRHGGLFRQLEPQHGRDFGTGCIAGGHIPAQPVSAVFLRNADLSRGAMLKME